MTLIPPGPRYRERGSTTRDSEISWYGVQCNGLLLPTQYQLSHRYGVVEGMHDVVTPNAKKKILGGEIINSPMTKVKQTFFGGGTWGNAVYSNCNSGTGTAIAFNTIETNLRNADGYLYNEVRDLAGRLTVQPWFVDVYSLQKHAHTKALAGVDDSTQQGLVSIGELGKTLATLRNPIKALTDYTAKWRKSRHLRKAIQGGGKAIADQYLTYYYGIKPTVQDIENAIQAYLDEGITNSRRTSRGMAADSKTTTQLVGGNPGTGYSWNTVEIIRSESLKVRAGILYKVDHMGSVSAQFGLRASDIPSAVLELTPWSFFANYFMNLNELVSALSPRLGVEYLAAWDVILLEQSDSWRVIANGTNQKYVTRDTHTEYAGRIIEGAIRIPTSPYSNIGLSLLKSSKIGNWSTQKDLAVTALLLQQTSGYHKQIAKALKL
ncbi:TPA_asm: maturation protein [ssRNA phage SRR7976299_15]|uniref:Maturation protein n=1 Tax=ssRNA phage SRR7976299_15 TaxID=2786637 RepID=A0A8S5L5B6_9VIRU|nr:maturation protein [ssRNA phage SRR7976299_15]DAD52652.1 TPA_asm: maturation protein [ssRNA phage SRR7976299_15]